MRNLDQEIADAQVDLYDEMISEALGFEVNSQEAVLVDPGMENDLGVDKLYADMVAVRPTRKGILQIQFEDWNDYQVYAYPNRMWQFNDYDVLVRFLKRFVNDDMLISRAIDIAANWHLADLDVHERTAISNTGYKRLF